MKKKLWFPAVVFAVFALVFIACGDGSGGGKNTDRNDDDWPVFSDAQKLTVEKFTETGQDPRVQWSFKYDIEAPHNIATYKASKFLVIASIGGGKNLNDSPVHIQEGFNPVKFQIDCTNSGWTDWNDATSRLEIQNKTNSTSGGDWIIDFDHDWDNVVYFIYDLDKFKTVTDAINNAAGAEIVFRFAWGPDANILGQYMAYITSKTLSQSGGSLMKNDGSTLSGSKNTLPDDTVIGWITKTPGLTVVQ